MLAICFSFVLGPLIWLPLLLVVFIIKTNLTHDQIRVLFPIVFIFQILIPLLYIAAAYKLKKIHDLDMSKKEERIIPLIISTIALFISLVVIKFTGSPMLFHLFMLLSILLFLNGIITIFWKISFHMGINVVSTLLVNFLYHWQFPILYLAIPAIYWSRLKLHKHTRGQLIAALVLNASIIFIFLKIYQYI